MADLALPDALAEVAGIGFEWEWDEEADEARGIDFEPYDRFEAPERTAWWLRLWTGNPEVDGREFRFFGTTGGGGYAGFWLVRPGAAVSEQPVVYLGSEGERGVIARDLGDLLWLFAAGLGPAEAFAAGLSPAEASATGLDPAEGFGDPGCAAEPNEGFRAIAERHAPGGRRSPAEIVEAARAEFPHFPDVIDAMCR